MSFAVGQPLDLQEQISRIERQQAETRKFAAEMQKLTAEGQKFNRDWWIVPITGFFAVLAAVVARLPEILHAFGVGP